MSSFPIGIDLGTSRSVVATIAAGRPRVIPNAAGQLLTPSVVAVTRDRHILVGQVARVQAAANPDRTVTAVKRFLGSSHRFRLGPSEHTAQELASWILRQLKEDAENSLGEPVEEAVIGVPAYFNDRQREAVREAALLAGLRPLRLINEPTAAALAYGLDRDDVLTVMVWDLGGGTFDVSILELGGGVFEVRAVSGDGRLGGEDFDQRVMAWLVEQYQAVEGVAFPEDGGSRERLREAAERAKRCLSTASSTKVVIPFVERSPDARHLDVTLTRTQLEALVADLLERLIPPTRQVLADAGLRPEHVDCVILVGNGTKMPAVREVVTRLMGREPYRALDPDLVTAIGAAIHAGMLTGQLDKVVLLDVLPLSLGMETLGGLFTQLVTRNSPLPASASRIFTTATDNQTAMSIHVLQGERGLAADNVSLGWLELENLALGPRGTAKVEVIIEVDVDGVAHVSALDVMTDQMSAARFVSSKQLDPQEVEHLIHEAQRHAEQDQQKQERIQAAIEASSMIAAAEMAIAALDCPGSPQVEALVEGIGLLRDALADGEVAGIRHRCTGLRDVLRVAAATPIV